MTDGMLFDVGIEKGAKFSPARLHRYSLWRIWDRARDFAAFVGLNPSTADETEDDATVRRCIGFAQRWGLGGMVMLNAFAYRATDPAEMKAFKAPVGLRNDEALESWTGHADCGCVVACWGNHGAHLGRDKEVRRLLGRVLCFGLTKEGQPKHPLYLPNDAELEPLEGTP